MTHDPRCPALRYAVLGERVCSCEIIAEANAKRDELLRQGEERMLRWAIKTVESIGQAETNTLTHGEYLSRRSVLAALRALQP
jgi:hypothetical protein